MSVTLDSLDDTTALTLSESLEEGEGGLEIEDEERLDDAGDEIAEEDDLSVSSLPSDVRTLRKIVLDLSRRLQNANHTIESQKARLKQATYTTELFRNQIGELSNALRLETSKNIQILRKKAQKEESERYEKDNKKLGILHEDLRLALIDHAISGLSREPLKLGRLRKHVNDLEQKQDSQKMLLEHLTKIDGVNEELGNAAQRGDVAKCSLLLRRGAKVNELDAAGFLPLHYACANNQINVAQLLLEFGADASSYLSGSNPVQIAARHGNWRLLSLLVDFGASLDDGGLSGSPPIVSAASQGHKEVVEELICLGADVNGSDLNSDTALHVATKIDDPASIIHLLLKFGANATMVNRQSRTPLQLALALVSTKAITALGGRSEIADDEYSSVQGSRSYFTKPDAVGSLPSSSIASATKFAVIETAARGLPSTSGSSTRQSRTASKIAIIREDSAQHPKLQQSRTSAAAAAASKIQATGSKMPPGGPVLPGAGGSLERDSDLQGKMHGNRKSASTGTLLRTAGSVAVVGNSQAVDGVGNVLVSDDRDIASTGNDRKLSSKEKKAAEMGGRSMRAAVATDQPVKSSSFKKAADQDPASDIQIGAQTAQTAQTVNLTGGDDASHADEGSAVVLQSGGGPVGSSGVAGINNSNSNRSNSNSKRRVQGGDGEEDNRSQASSVTFASKG